VDEKKRQDIDLVSEDANSTWINGELIDETDRYIEVGKAVLKPNGKEMQNGPQELLIDDDLNYFGHCPIPEHENQQLNIGRGHWGVCHTCKIKWFIGSNIFRSWPEENEEIWRANSARIMHYTELSFSRQGSNKEEKSQKNSAIQTIN
jgi:hypothetical protein